MAMTVPAGRQRRSVESSAHARSETRLAAGAFVFPCTISCGIESQSLLLTREWALAQHELFGRRTQSLGVLLIARFSVGAHHRFCARKAVADPRAIVQNQLEPVGPDDGDDFAPAQLLRIGPQLLSERGFLLRGQVEVLSNREIGTNLGKKRL